MEIYEEMEDLKTNIGETKLCSVRAESKYE
jgi:hypothetical protein